MIPGSSAPRDVGSSLLAAPGLPEELPRRTGPWGAGAWLLRYRGVCGLGLCGGWGLGRQEGWLAPLAEAP